jgi:S1-C subfamily serine protease
MIHRRTLFACFLVTVASASGFATGVFHARRAAAATPQAPVAAGPSVPAPSVDAASRAALVAEVKKELEKEMGLLPVSLLRDRRSSFVELYSYDKAGKTHYGTAGYLGHGYFITVKHAVIALAGEEGGEPSPITSVRVVYKNEEIPAKVVDAGAANVEVDPGDWAIVRTRDLDLPALHVDSDFAFDFADPIFRLGNDYSRGIILSTGYVGQRTSSGLVTCLIDGHPGVSGGGVLNRQGDLVGIPIGRLEGDYRFSFLLPVRAEMFRKVPELVKAASLGVS